MLRMNPKINLMKKLLPGYLAIIFLIGLVGVISIVQFRLLGKKVAFLTKHVASNVRLASEIEERIFSMRSSVENFIYRNRKEDNLAAEANINRVK